MSYSSSSNNNNRRRRRMGIRREKRSREEDFIGFKTGPVLMPPHWDRKHEYEYDYEYGHDGGRWRDSSSSPFAANGSRYSYHFQPRCSFPSHFRRHSGHGKQAEWHLYQEGSPHEYPTPSSGDRFMDGEYFRPSGPQRNGRYGRNYRDNRSGLGQKEWRGRSWDNNRQDNRLANTSGRQISVKNQRSVGNSPVRASHPNSDPSLHFLSKYQADKTCDGNGSGVSHRIRRENSLGGLDWKLLKCSRSGSLTSGGSFFSHSSSSKSIGGETCDVEDDLALKNVTPVQSPSGGDIVACAPSAVPAEDLTSRKKPRLGWGEGLAKYEKKNVEGFEENATTFENIASVGIVEPAHPVTSNLVEMSPEITGFSDCSSPARPSSFTCSSSPGLEEKTYAKTIGDDSNNLSASMIPLSEKQTEGMQFNLEKLELNLIANLSSLLDELLYVDEQFSTDSGLMRSSALSKLLLWKGEISKTLELTETEIDSLETELKLLNGNSYQGIPCSDLSKYSPIDDKYVHGDGPNGFASPLPLGVGSSEDIIMESALPSHYARDNHAESKGEDIGSPGTATSKFSELFFAQKAVSPCGWQNSCSSDSEFGKSSGTMLENVYTCDNKRTIQRTHSHVNGEKAIKDASVAAVIDNPRVCDKKEDNICDLILASNKETSCIASEMLTKLLPDDNTDNRARGIEACRRSCLTPDITIKKKFWSRKRLLRFKERVISLKYRAFYHLWKEDLCLDRNHRLKSHKKIDVTSQTLHMGKQKRRSAVRARFHSPAGSLSSDLSTEILNLTRKLLSDTKMKNYRSSLKMPAMILDEKDKMSSRFMSSNGLVEDPCAVEKERALINPWTFEEKEIFMDKLTSHGKDFRKIASFLDHKTIADCIQFYYKNHKSESFEKIRKLGAKKQVKPLYSDTYMLTSEKKWGREVKPASLDILGEVSAIAALTDQAMKSFKLTNKNPRRSDFVTEVATKSPEADLLSFEAMDSCITNSVGPNDGKDELKHRKVCSFVRRLSTPDISLNVGDDDEDTCSDEICGERDFGDWTDEEKFLFVRAFSTQGKDFLTISGVVKTKTRDQCKVFFSKGRKCLGLEKLISGSCSGRLLGSKATNGSGSDIEDGAGVVKMRYVGCSGKSDSRTERELPHVTQNISKLDSTGNCGPGQLGCKEIDMEPEVLWPADVLDIGLSGVFDGSTEVTHVSSSIDPESVSEATNVKSVVSCEILDPDCTSSRDGQRKHSRCSGSSNHPCEGVTDLLVDLTVETESNVGRTHKPGSRKVQSFQERHFRKCSGAASQNDHMVPSRSSDTCSGSGIVKRFENILSKTSSIDKEISISWQYDETTNHHLTSNGIADLENVPVRNYGIWDGNKIKVVGYPPSAESSSALLLAKYPPVNSGKCNQNNACQFSPREYNYANDSFVDYPIFTLDFKKRQRFRGNEEFTLRERNQSN